MQRLFFVHPAMRSIAKNASVDGGACEVVRTHRAHESFVQRFVVPLITLADEDTHQFCFALDLDVCGSRSVLGFRDLCRLGDRGLL